MRNAFTSCGAGHSLEDWAALLADLDAPSLLRLRADWLLWARPDQLPPATPPSGEAWRTWLILGGRGAGKTRAGAEWIRMQALGIAPYAERPAGRIALIGETYLQTRNVMVEGVSGLLSVHGPGERPTYEPSKRRITWPNGTVAELFSADDPESLRGPQFACAWADEIAKWKNAEAAHDMLQFALRLGVNPRLVATTTPRPVPLIEQLIGDPATVMSQAPTVANALNLAPAFVADMARRYAGTALGRQELEGELIDETAGCLWKRDWIEAARVTSAPELAVIVVAVDPPMSATERSDACGIVVAGKGADGRFYVLDDRTVQGREASVWARAVVAAARDFAADRVVAEVNQGGDLVPMVLAQIDPGLSVTKVRASRGKWVRAEPVASLYAEGRVAHVGVHAALEAEMLAFGESGRGGGGTGGGASGRVAGKAGRAGRSPDRVDALVWALSDLMGARVVEPGVRML